jgi:hypothetical protein
LRAEEEEGEGEEDGEADVRGHLARERKERSGDRAGERGKLGQACAAHAGKRGEERGEGCWASGGPCRERGEGKGSWAGPRSFRLLLSLSFLFSFLYSLIQANLIEFKNTI